MHNDRPSFRVPAAWLTVAQPDGAVAYFALDASGKLALSNGKLIPHHIEPQGDTKFECDCRIEQTNQVGNIWQLN